MKARKRREKKTDTTRRRGRTEGEKEKARKRRVTKRDTERRRGRKRRRERARVRAH